jgi:hypothetical protein
MGSVGRNRKAKPAPARRRGFEVPNRQENMIEAENMLQRHRRHTLSRCSKRNSAHSESDGKQKSNRRCFVSAEPNLENIVPNPALPRRHPFFGCAAPPRA